MGRSNVSVGKMGRDGGVRATPVDHYRRQIARQDSKKEKNHMKAVKTKKENREKAPKAMRDLVLLKSYPLFDIVCLQFFYCSGPDCHCRRVAGRCPLRITSLFFKRKNLALIRRTFHGSMRYQLKSSFILWRKPSLNHFYLTDIFL